MAEVRRLFNLPTNNDQAIDQALRASTWRRAHQAQARLCHFRHRIRLQMIEI